MTLEDKRKGIEVFAVRTTHLEPQQPAIQRATVFVPDDQLKHFVTRFEQYSQEQTKKGEPRHKEAIDRIAALRRATLRALWTDAEDVFPTEQEDAWWESGSDVTTGVSSNDCTSLLTPRVSKSGPGVSRSSIGLSYWRRLACTKSDALVMADELATHGWRHHERWLPVLPAQTVGRPQDRRSTDCDDASDRDDDR